MDAPRKPPRLPLADDFRPPRALDVFFAALLRPPLDQPRPLLDPPRPPLLDDFRPRLPFDDFLEDALAAALASDRPFVLDVVCDPEVPLLPPAPRSSRRHYVMALAKGDRNAMRAIRESLKQVFG